MFAALASAFAAGLVGSPHCVGMCGGLASSGPSWHLGRLLTYLGLGAGVAGVGAVLPGPVWLPSAIAAVFVVLVAAQLAGLKVRLPGHGLFLRLGRLARRSPLLLGVASGFLPCGLLYAALGMSLGTASPLEGAALMVCFWGGTLPLLAGAALGLRRLVRRAPGPLIGALVLVLGLGTLAWRLPTEAPPADAAEACH